MEWSRKYTIGIEKIDEQHRQLFEMINELHDSMESKDIHTPKKILIELMEYTLNHFQTEEKYFKIFQYSDAEPHITQHVEFEAKVKEFLNRYQKDGTFNVSVISDFIKRWIIDHVLISDRKYVKCFTDNGLC
jgi:hemerythrin-like metal-binding protein